MDRYFENVFKQSAGVIPRGAWSCCAQFDGRFRRQPCLHTCNATRLGQGTGHFVRYGCSDEPELAGFEFNALPAQYLL
jgi:hypothetical protein